MSWDKKNWRKKPRVQMPAYGNIDELVSVEKSLEALPPLVFAGDVSSATLLSDSALGLECTKIEGFSSVYWCEVPELDLDCVQKNPKMDRFSMVIGAKTFDRRQISCCFSYATGSSLSAFWLL